MGQPGNGMPGQQVDQQAAAVATLDDQPRWHYKVRLVFTAGYLLSFDIPEERQVYLTQGGAMSYDLWHNLWKAFLVGNGVLYQDTIPGRLRLLMKIEDDYLLASKVQSTVDVVILSRPGIVGLTTAGGIFRGSLIDHKRHLWCRPRREHRSRLPPAAGWVPAE